MTANPVPIVIGLALAAIIDAATAPAQSVQVGALPGLIVDAGGLPLDAAGRPRLDAVPGVRARQALPDDVVQRLLELSEQRDAIGAASPAGAAAAPIAPLPGDVDAPARFDSGDRDPDRLRSAPPLPRNR